MPIDYSKWKDIEVSDDEDDTHPNIDTPSLFRWRHQARLERMAEMKQAKEEVNKGKSTVKTRMQEIEEKLEGGSLDEKEKIKLALERDEIKKQEEEYQRKEKELADKERLAPWNVDTIGHDGVDKSIVNKVSDKKPEKNVVDEEEDNKRMLDYFNKHDLLLKKFSTTQGFTKTEELLLDNPFLASEYATSWMTIEALNRAIDNDFDTMNVMTEQCITVQYLLELAKSLHALATNTNVIRNFFKKIRAADHHYMKMYRDEVESFQMRLRKRAKDKIDAAVTEMEADERQKRIEASPGGLDPQEIYNSLPESMREAFASQSVEALMHVAETMDQEVFQHHLNRCIASGLWVPNAKDLEGEEDEEEEAKNASDNKTEA